MGDGIKGWYKVGIGRTETAIKEYLWRSISIFMMCYV